MRTYNLKMTPRRRWTDHCRSDGEWNVLFCPTDDPAPTGELARVRLVWPGGPQYFLSGVVVWCRRPTGAPQSLRPGVGIQLHPAEGVKIRYIRDWVTGQRVDRRLSPRLPVRLPVVYKNTQVRRINCTQDINASGMLLRSSELIGCHTGLSLDLRPPGELMGLRLQSTVVRHVLDAHGIALGLRLDFQNGRQRLRYARLVADLEQALRRGELEDRYLAA